MTKKLFLLYVLVVIAALYLAPFTSQAQQDTCTITNLPHFEDFSTFSTGYIPDSSCWRSHAQYTGYYGNPTIVAQGLGGSNCLRLTGTGSYNGAAMPQMSDQFDISGLMVTFHLKVSQIINHLVVGVMTDATDVNTFTPVDTVYNPTSAEFYLHHVYLNNYADSGRYITFRWIDNDDPFTSSFALLDDITVQETPSCAMVDHLTVDDITARTARIRWEDGSLGTANSHTVAFKSPDSGMTTVTDVTGNEYILNNLNFNTPYTAYVTVFCDNGMASLTDSISFTTACLSGGDLLFGEDENITARSFPSHKYALTEEIFTASDIGGARTLQSISLHCSSVGSNRNVAVYLMPVEQSNLTHFINIDNTAVKVFDGVITMTSGWVTIPFDENYYYDGATNLMLVIDDNTGAYGANTPNAFYFADAPAGNIVRYYNNTYSYMNPNPETAANYNGTIHHFRHQVRFDDVCNNLSACAAPYVYIGGTTDSTAELNIYPMNGETQWMVEHRRAGDSTWTTTNYVNESHYFLTGLSPNTMYEVRVNPDCDSPVVGHWTTRTFHTDCGPLVLPYEEDFDETAITDGIFMDCWRRHSSNPSQQAHLAQILAQAHSGERYLSLPAAANSVVIASLPEITAQPLNTLEVEFFLSHPGNAVLEIGVMNDSDEPTTFQVIDTISAFYTDTYEKITYPLDDYTGNGIHIAFRVSGGAGGEVRIDDLKVDAAPECLVPLNVTVQNTEAFSSEISWTEPGSATQWSIEYGVTGFVPGTGTVVFANTNPFTLTGLLADHTYGFYLRSECDSAHHSDWTNVYTFDTPCFEIDHFPYSENFSTPGTGNGYHNLPECWNRLNSDNVAIYNGSLGFSYYGGVAVMPRIADSDSNGNPIDIRLLKLDLDASYYNGDDRVTVGVMTDPSDAGTFQAVKEINVGYDYSSSYRHDIVYFYGYLGTGRYIAVKNHYGSNGDVDNFVISERDFSCSPPDSLRACHIGSGAAQIRWSAGEIGNALQYTLQYKKQNDTLWTTTGDNLIGTAYWLNSLTPSTKYDIRVRTRCTDSTFGAWSAATFTTNCATSMPLPFSENFNNVDVLPDCWTQEYVRDTLSWTTAFPYPYPWGAHSSPNAARFYAHDWGRVMSTRLISPMLDLQNHTQAILRFWFANAPNNSDPADTLRIQYRPSPSADWITLTSYTQCHSSWTQDSLFIPGGSDSCQIAFFGAIGQGYGIYIDDISVTEWNSDEPTPCEPVQNLTATGIGNDTIALSWSLSSTPAAYWTVKHRQMGSTSWDSATTTINAFTLHNLEGLTPYEIFVETHCLDGQMAFSDTITVTTTNVSVPTYERDISLHPNPTSGLLTIQSQQSPIRSIKICNLVGQYVLCVEADENTVRMDISELRSGVYFAKVSTADGQTVRKVVKQ